MAEMFSRASNELRAAEARAVAAERRAQEVAEKAIETARRAADRVADMEHRCTLMQQQLENSAKRLRDAEKTCASIFAELIKATEARTQPTPPG